MENIITFDTLRNFGYSNDQICSKPIRGLVFEFFGLGGQAMLSGDPERAKALARQGILFVIPYYNPWSWMNRQAVAYTDEIANVLFQQLRLQEDLPIVFTGGSMGGLSALVYTRYSKRTPTACVANCPVCDLPFHYTERPDLPRTLYSAFFEQDGTLEEAMKANSPLHLVSSLPDAAYTVFHCEEDKAVSKALHSDKFVSEMKKDHRITYYTVPGRGHCDLTEEMWVRYDEAINMAIDNV